MRVKVSTALILGGEGKEGGTYSHILDGHHRHSRSHAESEKFGAAIMPHCGWRAENKEQKEEGGRKGRKRSNCISLLAKCGCSQPFFSALDNIANDHAARGRRQGNRGEEKGLDGENLVTA